MRDQARLAPALAEVETVLAEIDLACSRFREDSELVRLNRNPGVAVPISAALAGAIGVALRGARLTAGLVDPTVGTAMRLIGYDRDFAEVSRGGAALALELAPAAGWEVVEFDPARRTVRVPAGVELDLGATAKAHAADLGAARAARECGCGVLVSLGGDISVSGEPPPGGWPVLVTDDHRAPSDAPGQLVHLSSGGLATSSTTVRHWRRGGVELHHIVNPATGLPARTVFRTVSVAAASCVDANIASTAAMVMGEPARAWLEARALPARLVHADGVIEHICGWTAESESA
ncbi:MAG: FAD:protein FMN transferase [Candidatus Dormibacteria bacterium]